MLHSTLGKILFTLLTSVFVVAAVYGSYEEYNQVSRLKSLVEVKGTVLAFFGKEVNAARGQVKFAPKITVAYVFNGLSKVSKLRFYKIKYFSAHQFEKHLSKYEPRETYSFYVNSERPEVVYAERPRLEFSFYSGIFIALAFSFLIIKLWMIPLKSKNDN